MKVAEATKESEPVLRQMLYLAANWRGEDKPLTEVLADPKVDRYVKDWGRPGDGGVVGTIDLEPVGAAWYRLFTKGDLGYGFVDEDTPELTIGVERAFQGKGLGTILLSGVLALAKTDGYSAVSLSVEPENEVALKLYEKYEFEKVGVNGGAWTMLKQLG